MTLIGYSVIIELTKIGREAVMTQSSMPTEPLKSGFLSKRNDPLCRLRFAGGIFTVSRPTGRRNIYEYPSDYLSFRFQIIFEKVPTFLDSRVYMGESFQ